MENFKLSCKWTGLARDNKTICVTTHLAEKRTPSKNRYLLCGSTGIHFRGWWLPVCVNMPPEVSRARQVSVGGWLVAT